MRVIHFTPKHTLHPDAPLSARSFAKLATVLSPAILDYPTDRTVAFKETAVVTVALRATS
jgi:hypothetical protein